MAYVNDSMSSCSNPQDIFSHLLKNKNNIIYYSVLIYVAVSFNTIMHLCVHIYIFYSVSFNVHL